MKFSEFYEKYWFITLPNGERVTPTLSNEDREVLDKADELGVPPYVRVFKRNYGFIHEVHPLIKSSITKTAKRNK
jgi:hypothetical protein